MNVKEKLEEKRLIIDDFLNHMPRGEKNLLTESMAYSLQCGGKRLRPSLFLIVSELYGMKDEDVMPFAAAIEMIHTYSLIHDDLPAMDDDDYRRGKLTNHKIYGEAQAILAGDGLLTEAFYLMAIVGAYVPANRVLAAIAHGADLAGIGGMVRGQTFDVEGEKRALTIEELQGIHRDKTGALIRFSLMSAAILAGASGKDIEKLSEYGHYLGLAFQIEDDILDHESTFEELGKPIGSDAAQGKTTYISLLGLDGAKSAASDASSKAKAALQGLSVDASLLREIVDVMLTRRS